MKLRINSSPVAIGNDVLISTTAIVLNGVTIDDISIIGAGSVVSKDVPADEIWADNPAVCVSRKNNLTKNRHQERRAFFKAVCICRETNKLFAVDSV